ncbi:hypothetical protein [Brevibacterium spongiae]|uniref:Uncharacterized protein n=1 Tax=Brevibacterium spongiae TaxID=2909672 RepID=A0ABY5SRT1_9MICO|nr:hypothetical protein [Brevibacterium spongiae]UVI36899.1 hypothetical protein L1F31_04380 [Brevibacterium spongiae]
MDTADKNGSTRWTSARGRSLNLVARVLPIGAVACWVITIFVPVLDSGGTESMRVRVTSLGFSPIDMNDLDPGYLTIWIIIVTGAFTAWLLSASKWWSIAAIVLGTVLGLRLLQMVADPPFLMWDGQTANGMPTGGMEVAYPAAGFGFWVLGSALYLAAGICGLVAAAQKNRHRRERIKRCMAKRHGHSA